MPSPGRARVPVQIEVAGDTHIGGRPHNEDAILLRPDLNLFIVADGAGGQNAGNVASSLAVTTVAHFFEQTQTHASKLPLYDALGLTKSATSKEVRRAYRSKISKVRRPSIATRSSARSPVPSRDREIRSSGPFRTGSHTTAFAFCERRSLRTFSPRRLPPSRPTASVCLSLHRIPRRAASLATNATQRALNRPMRRSTDRRVDPARPSLLDD